jgi:hypothetical protein
MLLAIDEARIIADAETFDELTDALTALGKDPREVLIVQAGTHYPESAWILLKGIGTGTGGSIERFRVTAATKSQPPPRPAARISAV